MLKLHKANISSTNSCNTFKDSKSFHRVLSTDDNWFLNTGIHWLLTMPQGIQIIFKSYKRQHPFVHKLLNLFWDLYISTSKTLPVLSPYTACLWLVDSPQVSGCCFITSYQTQSFFVAHHKRLTMCVAVIHFSLFRFFCFSTANW